MLSPAINVVDLITNDQDKKFEPMGRMANAIITLKQRQGDCLPQDLNEQGFTSAEVTNYWHMANALASVELKELMKNDCIISISGR